MRYLVLDTKQATPHYWARRIPTLAGLATPHYLVGILLATAVDLVGIPTCNGIPIYFLLLFLLYVVNREKTVVSYSNKSPAMDAKK